MDRIGDVLKKARSCEKKKEKLEVLVDEKGFPSVLRISKKKLVEKNFRFYDYFPTSKTCLNRCKYFLLILKDNGLKDEKLALFTDKEILSIAKNIFLDSGYDKSEKDLVGNADLTYEYFKAALVMFNIKDELELEKKNG